MKENAPANARVKGGVIVHLGLGAFHRAHQAWYTQRANLAQGENWQIWAFTGRSSRAADVLSAQDCRYCLIERGQDGDRIEEIVSITRAADGADAARWRDAVADPKTAIVTLTVTERGYCLDSSGQLDMSMPDVVHDAESLRVADPQGCVTPIGRLTDGLRARWERGGAAISVVSCDNLPANGRKTRDAVHALATALAPEFVSWLGTQVEFVNTMVDRITPATTVQDVAAARALSGWDDRSPVVTEPYTAWVLEGRFSSGRPAWEVAGALIVDDVEPFERRKLWLLNAGHTSLALNGLRRGHSTVAEAMADQVCRRSLYALWGEAFAVLPFSQEVLRSESAALVQRFENARIEHRLAQIATDSSAKLGPRILDAFRARRRAGLPDGPAQAAVIASWIAVLERPELRQGDAIAAPLAEEIRGRSAEETAALALRRLDPDLAEDGELVTSVARALAQLHAPLTKKGSQQA